MTRICCTDCNGHAGCKCHVCDAACMHACNVTYVHCYQDETRHRHCNVFDERAICVRRRACPSAYRVPPHSERRSKRSSVVD